MTFRPMTAVVDESLAQDRLVALLAGFFGALALAGEPRAVRYDCIRRGTSPWRNRRSDGPGRSDRGYCSFSALPRGVPRERRSAGRRRCHLWASRFVASLLNGLAPHDPTTFVGAAFMLVALAALAAWIPCVRRLAIDPAEVLREA